MSVGSLDNAASAPKPAPAPAPAPAPKPTAPRQEPQDHNGSNRPAAEAPAKSALREPITKIASEAKQDKSRTLAII